jgi:hypothetical protein
MSKLDKLSLMLGADIIIPNTSVKIHQPTMNEIALIGEERFFYSLNGFVINMEQVQRKIKEKVTDKEQLKKMTANLNEYIILLQFLQSDKKLNEEFETLCNLLFIDYKVQILPDKIKMISNDEQTLTSFDVDLDFFLSLKNVTQEIFKLSKITEQTSLNPKGKLAENIASKMQKSREKIEKLKGEAEKTEILSYYVSILGIGTNSLNVNSIKNLTIYQLYDQLERFNLYSQYDQSVRAALAGAKVDIVDWLKKI